MEVLLPTASVESVSSISSVSTDSILQLDITETPEESSHGPKKKALLTSSGDKLGTTETPDEKSHGPAEVTAGSLYSDLVSEDFYQRLLQVGRGGRSGECVFLKGEWVVIPNRFVFFLLGCSGGPNG